MRSNPKSKKGSENIQHTLTFLFSAAKSFFFFFNGLFVFFSSENIQKALGGLAEYNSYILGRRKQRIPHILN